MPKFYFFFLFLLLFAFGYNNLLKADSCGTPNYSGGRTSLSNCNYDSQDPLEYKGSGSPTDFTFSLKNITGNISEIKTQNTTDASKHTVTLDASKIAIGKLYNNVGVGGVDINGSLELKNNSEVTFIGDGLQTDSLKITDSNLTLDGASATNGSTNKVGSLEMDEKSGLTVTNGASLEIGGGVGIKKNLDVINGSSVTLNYDKTGDTDVFTIGTLNLNGENSSFTKTGAGKVVINSSYFSADINKDFHVIVDGGILDVASIGNQSDKSIDSFYVKSGQLKFNQGDFKAKVDNGGELYYFSDSSNAIIKINSGLPTTGKLIAEGKELTLMDTNLDTLEVKDGNVTVKSQDSNNQYYSTNITNLNITGGVFGSGTLSKNQAYFENISISNGGKFNYATNDFSSLKSLKIFDKGEFIFLGLQNLTLDNVDAGQDGIITLIVGANPYVLTLTNSHVATINLTSNRDSSSLNISDTNEVGRLNINFMNADSFMDITGSNIKEIEMQRRGTLTIGKAGDQDGTNKDITIDSIINSSAFNPNINIHGGNITNVALNNSGHIAIDGNANIGTVTLTGQEKVNIDGGTIGMLEVNSNSKKAELNMTGGDIDTFKLEQVIAKLNLDGTKINNYIIAIEDQTFDFAQENVKNLTLDGKKSIVNMGDGTNIPKLETITLDQGTLNYNYNQDNYIKTITTTKDHPIDPPQECEDDDTDCKEENDKKPLFDTEFKVNADKAVLTVDDMKIENLNLQSGYININNSMDIQRKLTIGVDETNKLDVLNSRAKINSMGDVKLAGELQVEFNSTYDFLLGVENKFNLIHSDTSITKAEDSEFKFLTNLSYWFDVKEEDSANDIIVSINRKYLYSQVVEQNNGGGGIYDVASLLDSMIQDNSKMPDHMKDIITGLDTHSADGNALITNISKLMPVSNRVYSSSIHTNNYKVIDNLSSELRDFTNSEDNVWVKTRYSLTSMRDNKDVIGYAEDSNSMQIGYSKIISSKAILGGLVNYTNGYLNGNHSNFKEDFNTINASLGVDYLFTPQYYGKLILGYSTTNFDNTRNLSFINSFDNSNLSSSEVLAHIESGYITILPPKYHNFNATYNVFYSVGSIAIDSYSEEGIGRLNVDGANILVNDFGVGATFDKELLYDDEDQNISLKPSASFAMGLRYYSGADTKFNFQEIDNNKFAITNGSYLPIFIKSNFAVDYITNWANISVGYRFEADVTKYTDSSFYLSFKHSF